MGPGVVKSGSGVDLPSCSAAISLMRPLPDQLLSSANGFL